MYHLVFEVSKIHDYNSFKRQTMHLNYLNGHLCNGMINLGFIAVYPHRPTEPSGYLEVCCQGQ